MTHRILFLVSLQLTYRIFHSVILLLVIRVKTESGSIISYFQNGPNNGPESVVTINIIRRVSCTRLNTLHLAAVFVLPATEEHVANDFNIAAPIPEETGNVIEETASYNFPVCASQIVGDEEFRIRGTTWNSQRENDQELDFFREIVSL
ncbi:unnamed protein product [Arabis nemorensis]|uniref:Uncharacterized protein n=1 Tax=Arabis nemorensis TaxID=586526 RepID=A0A565BUB3_9BRAS|nr:unnamed protein product [Arabis nemorensis]